MRGLFLRHYLSGQTRDHLPVGSDDGVSKAHSVRVMHSTDTCLKPYWQPSRLDQLRAHELHRNEQALGPASAPGTFS